MHFDPNTVKDTLTFLNNEQVKNILSPTTKAIGENLKDFYNATIGENMHQVFDRLRERRRGKRPATHEDFKVIIPLLQGASVQSDSTLQDRWANLMDSAIDQTEGYLPSFAQTLSEMSADEAHYLDRLWAFFSQPLDINTGLPFAMWPVEHWKLVEVYDPNFRINFNHAEYWLYKDKMGDEDKATYAKLNHIELVIQDLIRLGIISRTEKAEAKDHYLPGQTPMPMKGSETILKTEYALTHYGVSFIRAVSGNAGTTDKGGPDETARPSDPQKKKDETRRSSILPGA